jgi:crossover junction endonuclease EME1
VEKTEDIEDWVFNLAGDVAIRPVSSYLDSADRQYKLLSKSHLSFCATDGIKKGLTPGDVFELMLQEVQGVTPSAAAGIRTEFESFKVLMDAYEKAERRGRERAELMLQDCEVRLFICICELD